MWEFSRITFWYILLHSICVLGNRRSLRNYIIDWHILTHRKISIPFLSLWKDPMLLCNWLQPVYLLYPAGSWASLPGNQMYVFTYSQFSTHTLRSSVCVHAWYQGQSCSENKTLPLYINPCILVAGIWALNKGLKYKIKEMMIATTQEK